MFASLLALLLVAWLGVGGGPQSVLAGGNTWRVDGAAGTDPASCQGLTAGYTFKTIGVAIQCASSGDTINIDGANSSFNGIYCEEITVDLAANASLTLQGSASTPPPIIDGGHGSSRCLASLPQHSIVTLGDSSATPMTVTLRRLTIQNGDASDNATSPTDGYNGHGFGGGIFVYAGVTLAVTGSTIQGNVACSGTTCASGIGGGIDNAGGTVTLTNSSVTGNLACGNSCQATGGGWGQGGGIRSDGTLTLTNSSVSGNVACNTSSCTGNGGGIYNLGGTATLSQSAVSGNTSCDGDSCASGYGGGIDNQVGSTTLTQSTVSGNNACSTGACTGYGGGIADVNGDVINASVTLTNSAVSGNAACRSNCTGDPNGFSEEGGGIYNVSPGSGSAVVELTNVTVSRNVSCSAPCTTSTYAGGIHNESGLVLLTNTIVAGNLGPSFTDCTGPITDGPGASSNGTGYNIIGDGNGCSFSPGPGDQVGGNGHPVIDPRLGPLQNNGGPTQTMALGPTSPAIGAADQSTCLVGGVSGANNLDQRGVSRHAETTTRNTCDVGAYDTGGAVTIAKGWSLIGVPVLSSSTSKASLLVGSLNGQLGIRVVTALATYARGPFHLYVSGYSADQTLGASQGIFVLSSKAGQWSPPGSAYTSSQQVNLHPGWNLISVPYVTGTYHYRGLNGDDLKTALSGTGSSGCGLQEAAIDVNGGYQVYMPGGGLTGTAFHVPNTLGMWIECTNAHAWAP